MQRHLPPEWSAPLIFAIVTLIDALIISKQVIIRLFFVVAIMFLNASSFNKKTAIDRKQKKNMHNKSHQSDECVWFVMT